MPEFLFLVSFMGGTKSLKTISSYFRRPTNFKKFHQKQKKKKKNVFSWGMFVVLFMKTKTASVHTGVGKYREMKIRVKTLPAMVAFCKRSQ